MSAEMPNIPIDIEEDRYSRLRLISWWNQDILRSASVMVVGAGALGNEIIKNLALLGVGTIIIVDFDYVELSNLTRSPLFRARDEGKSKAQAAASAAAALNPDCRFIALHADVTRDIGCGFFRRVDVVIGGLDNREARLAVNRACWKVGTPWVDGAVDDTRGIARSFVPPDGPCYECTLGEQDRKAMAIRESCGFLAAEAYRRDRTPTTPTMASIIAGIQVHEAIKILHVRKHLAGPSDGLVPALIGKAFYFDAASYDCFTIEYTRNEDCLSHEPLDNIIETQLDRQSSTLADVASVASQYIGPDVTIQLPCEMVKALVCNRCGAAEPFYRLARSISPEEAKCPSCGAVRVPDVDVEYTSGAPYEKIPLKDLGFGMMEILPATSRSGSVQIEISKDLELILPV
ncbi:MAG: ThiF family adenylyltransferase [Armatimonadota bacterium]|nr:ThiF family adenylyltransferase [Armatimonadota bacterium]